MDQKEIKSLLKEAKESIKSKDYQGTVKLCKSVLKLDPANYTALVFCGAALHELGKGQQCIEAYKRAIEITPNQAPAWQGLVQHYEKSGIKSHPDLLEGYSKISKFFENDANDAKYIESTLKYAGALQYQENYKKALQVLLRLSKKITTLPVAVAVNVVQCIHHMKGSIFSADEENLHVNALDTLIKNPETASNENFKNFFALLYKTNQKERLIDECLQVGEKFNVISYPMEYLCRLYVETHGESDYGSEISVLVTKLFKLDPSNIWGYYAKGKYLFEMKRYSESIKWLKEGLEYKYNVLAAEVFIQAKLKFGDTRGAFETIQELERKGGNQPSDVLARVKHYKVEALLREDLELAEKTLKEWETENISDEELNAIDSLKAKLYVSQFNWAALKDILPTLKGSDSTIEFYESLSKIEATDLEDCVNKIKAAVSSEDIDNELLLLVAQTLWKKEAYESAAELFIRLHEKENEHPVPLVHLGKLFVMTEEFEKARMYLEKALKVYPSSEIGAALSDVYSKLGLHEQNKKLLSDAVATLKKTQSKWAWLRLGLLNLDIGDAKEAVVALQSAVRTDIDDCNVWESLADAYFERGSYQAALGAYKRALDLQADPIYPKLKIGTINRLLGEEKEAITILESLLKENGTYIPALVECAKTYYQIAKRFANDKLDRAALQSLARCLQYSMSALENDQEQVLPWKIIGDCATLAADFANELTVEVPSLLLGPSTDESVGTENVSIQNFMEVGTHCFLMALKVCVKAGFSKETQASLYNDTAYLYYRRALLLKDEQRKDFLLKALKSSKSAIFLKRTSHVYWNILGLIASQRVLNLGALAQHSFIKSLQLEPNNVTTWCNLGFFYFTHDEFMKAHACFSKGQSVEPSYSFSWIGQAIVAEQIQPNEAMDLYRHTCSLDNFPILASLGYTNWVCQELASGNEKDVKYIYNIEHLEAVQTSYDLMGFYIARHPDNALAYNLRGVIAGRLGYLRTARECFEKCLAMLTEPGDEKVIDLVRCNLALVILNQGHGQEALDHLELINNTDFTFYSVAAQAFTEVGEYEKSIDAYKLAEEEAPNKEKKSDVLIGLGLVLGKTSGLEAAKGPLLQSHKLNKKNVGGPLALVALALQQELVSPKDLKLAEQAYNNLNTINESEFLNDVATIKSLWFLFHGDEKSALKCLLRYVHMFPLNTAILTTLSQFLFQYTVGESYVTKFITKYVKNSNHSGSSCEKLLALRSIRDNDYKQALVHAKKACHAWPEDTTHWIILIEALYEGLRTCKAKAAIESTLRTTVRLAQKAYNFCTDPTSEHAEWLLNYISHFTQVCDTMKSNE